MSFTIRNDRTGEVIATKLAPDDTQMTGWTRVAPGLYRKGEFSIERDDTDLPPGKVRWVCRYRNVAFDCGSTLNEAKSYCRPFGPVSAPI